MPSNLSQTVKAADKAGISYGEYMNKYGCVKPDSKPQKAKIIRCKDCKTDITHIKHGAKYCTFCAALHMDGG